MRLLTLFPSRTSRTCRLSWKSKYLSRLNGMKSLPFIVVKKPEIMQTIGLRALGWLTVTPRFSLFLRLWTTAHGAIPFLLTLTALALIYRMLPNTRVADAAAWTGGATAALLWKFKKLQEPLIVMGAALIGLVLYPLLHP